MCSAVGAYASLALGGYITKILEDERVVMRLRTELRRVNIALCARGKKLLTARVPIVALHDAS